MLKPHSRADVHFALEQEIGKEGRNSKVYEAYDPQLDARLVIKQVPKGGIDADCYFRESSILYGSAHSNVVPIHYACQDADSVYLAMPLYQAGSLKSLMAGRALTVREIVIYATQFLSGLHHIHSNRLVHFDVKPDNVLISDRNEALLADFGLAKPRGLSGVAGQDRIYGKMVAPESFKTDQFDHRFDIYQVGLTLYRMCTGDSAFYLQYDSYVVRGKLERDRFRHAVTNAQFPDTDSRQFPEHIPDKLISTIRRCLKTDPADRYASVIEVVNELASIDGELLDWQYAEVGKARVWTKLVSEIEIRLEVAEDGRGSASKRSGGATPRRISDYCRNVSRAEIKAFLRTY